MDSAAGSSSSTSNRRRELGADEVSALRRRIEELERENEMLSSRISGCPRCSSNAFASPHDDAMPSSGISSKLDHISLRNTNCSDILMNPKKQDEVELLNGANNELVKAMEVTSKVGMTGCQLYDAHHFPKRYVALKIMYFGQRFYGFASEAHMDPTVESEIFKALVRTKLLVTSKENSNYSRCGRTDKGVSSTGQVIALFVRSIFEDSKSSEHNCEEEIDYVKLLNRVLPKDIRVLGWCPVSINFHSRFSCLSREYKYFFWRGTLDIVAMENAGKKFIGEHDFRNFCKMDAVNVSNYRRRIILFGISPCNQRCNDDELYAITIRGSAFLWHQIRCMVAVLFMIGQGFESPNIIDVLLDTTITPRKPQYTMAPELSLILRSCEFEDLKFLCSSDAMRGLTDDLYSMIQTYVLQASIFREALTCLPVNGECYEKMVQKKRGHIPLMMRPTEPSFEERRAKIVLKRASKTSYASV